MRGRRGRCAGVIAGLAGLLTGPLAGRAAVYDADAPPDAAGPSVWITDGPTVLGARQLDARARGQVEAVRLVCTSSSSAGASSLALLLAGLLYKPDAADDTPWVDLGGHRIIKKKKK